MCVVLGCPPQIRLRPGRGAQGAFGATGGGRDGTGRDEFYEGSARAKGDGRHRTRRALVAAPWKRNGVREQIGAEMADDGAEATGATLALGGGDSPGACAGATGSAAPTHTLEGGREVYCTRAYTGSCAAAWPLPRRPPGRRRWIGQPLSRLHESGEVSAPAAQGAAGEGVWASYRSRPSRRRIWGDQMRVDSTAARPTLTTPRRVPPRAAASL